MLCCVGTGIPMVLQVTLTSILSTLLCTCELDHVMLCGHRHTHGSTGDALMHLVNFIVHM